MQLNGKKWCHDLTQGYPTSPLLFRQPCASALGMLSHTYLYTYTCLYNLLLSYLALLNWHNKKLLIWHCIERRIRTPIHEFHAAYIKPLALIFRFMEDLGLMPLDWLDYNDIKICKVSTSSQVPSSMYFWLEKWNSRRQKWESCSCVQEFPLSRHTMGKRTRNPVWGLIMTRGVSKL